MDHSLRMTASVSDLTFGNLISDSADLPAEFKELFLFVDKLWKEACLATWKNCGEWNTLSNQELEE